MGKFRKRQGLTLLGSVAFVAAVSPATGQQASGQQTATQPATTQQAPSQQLIVQQAQRNPARRVGQAAGAAGTGTGLTVTLDYLSSLRHDDNLRLTDPSLGSTTWWENTLALGILNQTPNSTLQFDLSGLYRIANEPIIGTDGSFSDPFTQLNYQRRNANSNFSLLASYRERDLAFNRSLTDVNLDGVIDAADVIGTIGDQVDTRGNLNWQTGLNDPLGFRFSYNYRERSYSGTVDPGLFDNNANDFFGSVLMQISPVLQTNVSLNYREFQADDTVQTDRNTTVLSTGATYDVSATTTVSANIGYSKVDDTQRVSNTSNVTEDFVWDFSWNKTLPDGSADILIDQTFGVNGSRINATFGRDFQRANGTFGFDIGFTRGPFDEVTPIGQLDYSYRLASSRIGATIQRRVGTSTQSVETRQTLAFLTYDYIINPVSALSFSVNYIDQENEGSGPKNPRQRGVFNASYSRAITRDWAVNMGYQYEYDDRNGFRATSNGLFVTLGRRFTLKP